MWFRFLSFLGLQLGAGVIGWEWLGYPGALVGVVLAGAAWMLLDAVRGLRVMHWLRTGEASQAPHMQGWWGEITDRTRRWLRQTQQKMQDAETRLQEFLAAIQASPNGVVLLDAQGRIEWCNDIAAEHFGFDAQRDLQQQIGNLVRDPAFAAYYADPDTARGTVMLGRGGSASRPLRLSVHLHPYGEGRKLLLSRDVTAVEQAEAMRRDFVANVSHEIRTPLTVMSGFVETMQSLPLDEGQRERYLGFMAQQAERMQTLVSDLLTLSSIEGSPMPSSSAWIVLHDLMAHCAREAEALSGMVTAGQAKSHVLRFGPMPEGMVAGASSELLSAMSNLVSNAVRYTPAGGRIEVRWQPLPDGRAEFSVKDTGPGIAVEHISRLTERFYRVDPSRSRETGGTGLGLAIVKHVVQRHGAELQIDSTVGQGSRFAIVFPANRLRLEAEPAYAK
nr:phosphate regulon sensor histidine kinase PhoR [uncultured Albidiferax sp.]